MTKPAKDMIWDYVVFIVFLIFSTVIPLWNRFFGDKKKDTKATYIFAVGNVSMFAMMLSIARGTLGVRSFLGYPAEIFYRGSAMWETLYGMVTAYPIVCFVFIPVYFSLGITSVYQYLDLRFKSRLVRCLASGTYIVRSLLNLGVTVFTPTVALNSIIGIPYYASIIGITAISIFFNLLGGLKAAITADVIQGCTTIFVSVWIIVQSFIEAGGPAAVIDINVKNNRLEFFELNAGLTGRVDTLSAWLGQLFMSMSIFGCQQNFVQRYLSMDTFKQVRRTLMSNIPVIIVLFSLSWVVGMGVYATFWDCDPYAAGYTQKMDEILPYFVQEKLNYMPGFMGLFLATLFNGALSLNVSNLNSLATVTWEDFISHLPYFKGLSDGKQLNLIKLIASIYGLLVMGVSFAVGLLSGVIESSMLMTSATSGPLLGVFLLALLAPMANWKGASIGMITSHAITLWITFGSFTIDKPPTDYLPTSTEGCKNDTLKSWLLTHSPIVELDSDISFRKDEILGDLGFPQVMYAVTYMYYSLIGTMITVFVGILFSYITASKDDAYDSKLLHPVIYRLSKWCPGPKRAYTNEVECSKKSKNLHKTLEQDNFGYDEEIQSDEKHENPIKFVPSIISNEISSIVISCDESNNDEKSTEKYRKFNGENNEDKPSRNKIAKKFSI